MIGRVVLFVALAGCNQLLDLQDTRLVDGPVVDKIPVTQKKVFLAQDLPGPMSATFMAAGAAAPGDAVVLLVGCQSYPTVQTDVQVSAPGWSFARLGSIEKAQSQYWATAVGAIAPDTQPVAVTVTWPAGSCGEIVAIGDEFGATDPRGGAMTFDARAVNPGESGDCTATLTTAHRNEAIWAACYSGDHVRAVDPPYTMTGNTSGGEMSGYLVTTDPPGTAETVTFANAPAPFVMTAVSLIPGL